HVHPSLARIQIADQDPDQDTSLWLFHQRHGPVYAAKPHAFPESEPDYSPDQYGCPNNLQTVHQTDVMPTADLFQSHPARYSTSPRYKYPQADHLARYALITFEWLATG